MSHILKLNERCRLDNHLGNEQMIVYIFRERSCQFYIDLIGHNRDPQFLPVTRRVANLFDRRGLCFTEKLYYINFTNANITLLFH